MTSTARTESEIAPGPNGSVYIAFKSSDGSFGDFSEIHKFLPNGSLDTSWGTNGTAFVNLFASGANETIDALVSLPDGALVALVHNSNTMEGRLLKLNASGARDNTFGSMGEVSFTSGTISGGLGLAVGPAGALYFGSWGGGQHKVSKVSATGVIDNAFGTNGEINVQNAKSFVVDSSGAIYVGGQTMGTGSMFPQGNNSTVLSKFLANGSADASFGTNGQRTLDTATNTEFHGALALSNNELTGMVYAGTTSFSAPLTAVYRMSTTGVMSSTFGTNGIKTFSAVTGSFSDFTRPRATVFADGSTILSIPGLGQTAVTELTALAPNGDVVAQQVRILSGDCNMRVLIPLATANGIYVAARHQPSSQQPDSTPYVFKFSITGIAAPTTTTAPPTTTVAPTTTIAPSTTVAPTTPVAPTTTVARVTPAAAATTTTTLPAPALAVVRALPVAPKPIVADALMATGEKVSVTFSGFRPFEFVQLIVASTPRVIGSGTANAQGVVTIQGNLPTNLGAGSHTLAVFAPASGIGFSQKITVSPATLPATGSNQVNLFMIAVLLFGLGLFVRRTTKKPATVPA